MIKLETKLKHYRESKRLTQKELAEKVGVRRETIVHLESNKYNPSLELALKISKSINIPIEDIFKLKEV